MNFDPQTQLSFNSPQNLFNNEENQNLNILNLMKQSKIYWQIKKEVINSILKNNGSNIKSSVSPTLNSSWQPSVEQILKTLSNSDNEDKIYGLITNCLQKSTRRLPIEHDPIPDIEIYRNKWSETLSKQFNGIATKIIRNEEYDEEDQSVNYTYDSSTMLEFLASIKIKNSLLARDSTIFMFPYDVVKVSKYPQIRMKWSYLSMSDHILDTGRDQQQSKEYKDREKKARKIVDGEHISSEIENYLCYGCVNGERINVYRRYFQCFYEYNGKRVDFNLYQKVWKPIIKLDCKQILKDPSYFVFKQEIEVVYKHFICDKQVSQMVKIRQLSPDMALDKYSPIHHILPCKSFSTYMAPFCYASKSVEDIYEIFRQFYCNYFIHLNSISSGPDSILSLCILFEELLNSTETKLVNKFEALSIQPVRLVFPWIFYCFIGYIEVEQLFLMLDRIVGMKSLEILPLYAMSVLYKCKAEILEAKSESEVIEILEDTLKEDNWIQTVRDFFKFHL